MHGDAIQSRTVDRAAISDDQRRVLHVTLALEMIVTLPQYTDDRSLPRHVEIACLESWMVNARLMAEFFVRPRSKADIHRHDFLPHWEGESDRREELDALWILATRFVAHLGGGSSDGRRTRSYNAQAP